ncbi:erythromycin esterase family protein [Jeongeupia naejangsanensis]|uniref:Erythromycin esterase family protein n=1 Tax=Jeongeupia naejangsanensis TaxID=613195 RepID=A0ABS2BPV2_9NEIS|nr:erythromycin esterase family protein [Jeongeupia naejangsanensis]MBM3117053.1 erythromycin esterase family protein [Jeongeupia naejangsanensis]
MAIKCAVAAAPDQFWSLLGQSVGSARIFLISTQTHGSGSDYALMSRIVKYLHTRHDFSVLCMASGFYDGLKIEENAASLPLRSRIEGALFRMYANAEELEILFDHIESSAGTGKALRLAGVDVPMGGHYSRQCLVSELVAYLDTNRIDRFGLDDFLGLCQAYLSLEPVGHAARREIMQDGFFRLDQSLSAEGLQGADFWRLMVENLKARYAFTELGQSRDLQMANNFRYLYESRHSGEKVILWGHACHDLPMEGNLGGFVKSWYGDDVYVCHLSGQDGQIVNFETGGTFEIPAAAPGFIEEKLSSLGFDTALVTAMPARLDCAAEALDLDDDIQVRLLAYSSSCQLNRVFSSPDERGLIDAIVFTRDIVPTRQIRR